MGCKTVCRIGKISRRACGRFCRSPISLNMGFTIYIPNGCKQFKIFLQLFYGNEANSNKPLKKNSGNERLVLPFPDT